MHLVSRLSTGVIHVSNSIQEQHTGLPFWDGKLDLTGEVMEMLEKCREDFPVARSDIGAHCVDDILGEVGVESGFAFGVHCG